METLTAIPTTPPRSGRRIVLLCVVVGMLGVALSVYPLWASYHWREAERALHRYDFPSALEHFERYSKFWPNDLAVRFAAARAARRGSSFERAESHLAACEERGLTPETALERALLRAQQGDLREVEGPLQALVIEGHPDAVLVLESLAQGYLAVYRLGFSMASIAMLLERDPDHPGAIFWRAGILEGAARADDALADYRKVLETAPHWPGIRLRLAGALLRNNKADEARPHFEELLRSSPRDAEVLLGAARCERALGQPSKALAHLDVLLRDHPEQADAWAERGRILAALGREAEALVALRRAVELDPNNYQTGYTLFLALSKRGLIEEAKPLNQRLERLKRDEQRLRDISELLGKNAQNPGLRYEAGMICVRNGIDAEALRWFLGALQDDPSHLPTHQALAAYHERLGDPEKATYHRALAGLVP